MEENINIIKIYEIESKFNALKKLKINEIEFLGIFYQINNNKEALKNSRFDEFRFYNLYLIYAIDLTFKSEYYKPNVNKNFNEEVCRIDKINNQEYNHNSVKELCEFMLENDYLIPIGKDEVERDKQFLEKFALNWAKICIDQRHSEMNLKIISKETRDILVLKDIKSYIEDNLNIHVKHDIFIGLLKSCYIFYEARKILEEIEDNNQPKEFELNGKSIELNLYSLIHVLYRHYGEFISPLKIYTEKSFHNTKIRPAEINFIINKLFEILRKKGLDKLIEIKSNKPILFNYFKQNYVIYISEFKYDKSKIIIDTFFKIDPTKREAGKYIERIKASKVYDLDGNLKIYIQNYNK